MVSGLLKWIREQIAETFAILAGLVIITLSVINRNWWGDLAFGVIIGVAVLILAVLLAVPILNRWDKYAGGLAAWILVIVPVTTALILRRAGSPLTLPVQISVPAIPSTQNLLLALLVIAFFILVFALGRALARGESVMVESHWGGIGGGSGGWRVSTPLIYLLGLLILGAIAFGVGWRNFAPMIDRKDAQPAATPVIAQSSHDAQAPTTPASSPTPSATR
jgi:hypothetical protein